MSEQLSQATWLRWPMLLPFERLSTTRPAFRTALRERDITTGLS